MTPRTALILIAALICTFVTCAALTIPRQSPTIDEPICTLAGYLQTRDRDYRFDADNPPLWKYWANLPNLGRTLKPEPPRTDGPVPTSSGHGAIINDDFGIATRRLFQAPGNDGQAFVNRARGMMLVVGVSTLR